MSKLRVAVLMGGKSTEHKISLISGREVVNNLDTKKYEVLPVIISEDGKHWEITDKEKMTFLEGKNINQKQIQKTDSDNQLIKFKEAIDLIFIAMHGAGGEDGKVQAFLDLLGFPYTGSGVLASAIGMDKEKSKIIFKNAGLKVPKGAFLRKKDKIPKFKYPLFVKPNSHGSSVGAHIARNETQLKKALADAFLVDSEALVEEYIEGTEITCAVLGNENSIALPLVEIVSKNEFFDYESKYDSELCDEICPARISKSLTKKAQEIAVTAYKAIGCRGFARIDMIIRGQEIYVLEVNTIPGLTPVSLFPKAAKASGITYSQLLDKIINYALA